MAEAALRVVMVSASFHPSIGGAENQALELSVALQRRGLGVRVLTRKLPGLSCREFVRGIPVIRLPCRGAGFLNAASFMASLFIYLWRQAPLYDVIHVHLAGSPALAAAFAGRLLGKPVVVKLGGGKGIGELAASARTFGGRLKLRLLARLKPQVIAVARELAEEGARYLGPVPIPVIPNGVDSERYQPASPQGKSALRRELGWPEEGLCFLYTGRFSWEKNLLRFIEVWAGASRAAERSFLAFVGEGQQEETMRAAARNLGVPGRVFFHGRREGLEKVYQAADIFILPSVSEGLSNALLEAMSSGLAILASRVGGTIEVVEEGREGVLFDPKDGAELKSRIERLLEKPVFILGQAARQKACRRYAMAPIAGIYEELYRKLIHQNFPGSLGG
ncbi:MAG: glycosyltransferase family 4 protein [Elusimicrobia bacterium]|nr:glycosyltransferase family 4 protein [Elusimicrobiota bacterium]